MPESALKKQLEMVRFQKTMEYVRSNLAGSKHLNSQELAQLNILLTGSQSEEDFDPWRSVPVTINLKSGRREQFSVISNSIFKARDIISEAREEAGQGDIVEAATKLYSQLVLSHLFDDANRRTAVVATAWLLLERSVEIEANNLLDMGLGDLRLNDQMLELKTRIKNAIIGERD